MQLRDDNNDGLKDCRYSWGNAKWATGPCRPSCTFACLVVAWRTGGKQAGKAGRGEGFQAVVSSCLPLRLYSRSTGLTVLSYRRGPLPLVPNLLRLLLPSSTHHIVHLPWTQVLVQIGYRSTTNVLDAMPFVIMTSLRRQHYTRLF